MHAHTLRTFLYPPPPLLCSHLLRPSLHPFRQLIRSRRLLPPRSAAEGEGLCYRERGGQRRCSGTSLLRTGMIIRKILTRQQEETEERRRGGCSREERRRGADRGGNKPCSSSSIASEEPPRPGSLRFEPFPGRCIVSSRCTGRDT